MGCMSNKKLKKDKSMTAESPLNLIRKVGDLALIQALSPNLLNLSAAESLIEEGKAESIEDALQQIRDAMF